jgi:lantibiotic modifying enzyme
MMTDAYLENAREVGDRLLRDETFDADASPWPLFSDHANPDPQEAQYVGPSIYMGVSGIAHFLLPLYRMTQDDRYLQAALRSSDGLIRQYRSLGPLSPGLYIGQAGPALALLETFEATSDRSYLESACEQAEWIADQPVEWLDLMNGPPGGGLLFMELYRTTGDRRWLEAARKCVRCLEETAEPYEEEGAVWPCRTGTDWRWITPGLAHGVAGVTVFLHFMNRTDPDSGAGTLARRAESSLLHAARERDGGLDWSHSFDPGNDRFLVQWCHGAPGVGVAFLGSDSPKAKNVARAAGRVTISAGDNRDQASQCHGVCGNAETLIELYRQTGEADWLTAAHRFAALAEPHRLAGQGPGAWRTHDSNVMSYDLMTGIAGVGYFFLRLADPLHVPYPVIGRWLPVP